MYPFSTRGGQRTRALRGLLAMSMALFMLLAGCSSSSKSTSGSGGQGSPDSSSGSGGEVAAAQKRLDPLVKPVEKIEVDTPLTRKPDTGKKVYFIRYNLPIAAEWDKPLTDAAKALGWTVTVDPVDATNPQSTSNAMLRAVSQHADYIAINSGNLQVMGPGLVAAKKAAIPIFLQAGVGVPGGAANDLYGNTEGDNPLQGTLRLFDLMIVDSHATGSALLVNAPDFPILTPIDPAVTKYVPDNCSGCSVRTLDISAADLAGDVASNIVATVRAHPDIKYVIPTFDGLANGLPQALKAAGLNNVKVYIPSPSAPFVQALAKGDYAAELPTSFDNRGWLCIDQIARQSLGMDTLQKEHGLLNVQLWTANTVPSGQTHWDPTNFEEQYKALWHVS